MASAEVAEGVWLIAFCMMVLDTIAGGAPTPILLPVEWVGNLQRNGNPTIDRKRGRRYGC
jgi:hypothetical protein